MYKNSRGKELTLGNGQPCLVGGWSFPVSGELGLGFLLSVITRVARQASESFRDELLLPCAECGASDASGHFSVFLFHFEL